MSIFQQIYDCEINFEISCFWDGGFTIKLGDKSNGYKAIAVVDTWGEVEDWFILMMKKEYKIEIKDNN